MRPRRVAIGIVAAFALVAALAAAGMIWMLLTDPARAVIVLQTGDLRLLLRELVHSLVAGASLALSWL